MNKVCNTVNYKFDLETRVSRVAISILVSCISFILLLFFWKILPGLTKEGEGDWIEGLKNIFGMRPEDWDKYLVSAFLVLFVGFLFLLFSKCFIGSITLTMDEISIRYPYAKLIKWFPWLKLKSPDVTIRLDKLERIQSDVFIHDNGKILVTIFESGNIKFHVVPGFIGYFDILADIEMHCPQVIWDENTRLIIDNFRKGISLYKTDVKITKSLQTKFEQIVPSWWSRTRIFKQARKEGIRYYRDLIEKAGGARQGV